MKGKISVLTKDMARSTQEHRTSSLKTHEQPSQLQRSFTQSWTELEFKCKLNLIAKSKSRRKGVKRDRAPVRMYK